MAYCICEHAALEFNSEYVKVLLRRAQSYEATDKLESALEGESHAHVPASADVCKLSAVCALADYKKVLELEPKSALARDAVGVGATTRDA